MADDDSRPGKECTRCRRWLALDAFYPQAHGPQGRSCRCKECSADQYRERTAAKKAEQAADKAAKLATSTKACPRCGETKDRSMFGADSRRPDGQRVYCKACNCAVNTASRARNIDSTKAAEKRWRDANKAAVAAKGKRWREANRDHARELAYKWRESNPERAAAIERRYTMKRIQRVSHRLRKAMSEGIRLALKGRKPGRTFDLIGMPFEAFKDHLQRQFLPGMHWGNYGKWHIDHIVPLSSFKITSAYDDDFRAAWSPSNLRPLWAKDNLRKHAKLTHLL